MEGLQDQRSYTLEFKISIPNTVIVDSTIGINLAAAKNDLVYCYSYSLYGFSYIRCEKVKTILSKHIVLRFKAAITSSFVGSVYYFGESYIMDSIGTFSQ
jgi:hypothetical protein